MVNSPESGSSPPTVESADFYIHSLQSICKFICPNEREEERGKTEDMRNLGFMQLGQRRLGFTS
jgi:hypothetical protein